MNREIKFRGKSISTGKWLYGYLLGNEDGKFAVVKPFKVNMDNECSCCEVDEETIGQFTGLKDKNGKEIYEGDVIESSYGVGIPARHFIGYNPREASFIANLIGEYPNSGSIHQGWIDKFCKKVIGNIHDNRELLEK